MNPIAWNQETDTAVSPERAPNDGEWAFYDNGGGRTAKKHYYEPVIPTPDTVIKITNVGFTGDGFDEIHPDGRVDLLSETTVNLACDIPLPNGTKVTIPVKPEYGMTKVIRASVVNGTISVNFKITPSGFWKVNSEELNKMGREGIEFQIDEIIILVQDI